MSSASFGLTSHFASFMSSCPSGEPTITSRSPRLTLWRKSICSKNHTSPSPELSTSRATLAASVLTGFMVGRTRTAGNPAEASVHSYTTAFGYSSLIFLVGVVATAIILPSRTGDRYVRRASRRSLEVIGGSRSTTTMGEQRSIFVGGFEKQLDFIPDAQKFTDASPNLNSRSDDRHHLNLLHIVHARLI